MHPLVTECGDRAIEGGAYIADIAAKRHERFSHHFSVPFPGWQSIGGTPP
jgi:hypothetical protein